MPQTLRIAPPATGDCFYGTCTRSVSAEAHNAEVGLMVDILSFYLLALHVFLLPAILARNSGGLGDHGR